MAELVIENLTKRYGTVTAIENVNITVADGEFVTLLGPSGCGKSTTLQSIAGLDAPTAGRIRVGNKIYFSAAERINLPPEERGCGLVFQSYALWPHMTVAANVAFPLKLRKVGAAERERRVAEALALVEMKDHADRYPHQLSGGQQQRVALARTIVYEPEILLLDEPLSNLDAKLRERARIWLCALQRKLGVTTVYVTHDQTEALNMSDRIVVMSAGRVAQIASPKDIYTMPADEFVADFIGVTNLIEGRIEKRLSVAAAEISLSGGKTITVAVSERAVEGGSVVIVVRPEHLDIVRDSQGLTGAQELDRAQQLDGANLLAATVAAKSYLGGKYEYILQFGQQKLRVESAHEHFNGDVLVRIPKDGLHILYR